MEKMEIRFCGKVIVKNATLAEIVQWGWEKYYAHLPQDLSGKAAA